MYTYTAVYSSIIIIAVHNYNVILRFIHSIKYVYDTLTGTLLIIY